MLMSAEKAKGRPKGHWLCWIYLEPAIISNQFSVLPGSAKKINRSCRSRAGFLNQLKGGRCLPAILLKEGGQQKPPVKENLALAPNTGSQGTCQDIIAYPEICGFCPDSSGVKAKDSCPKISLKGYSYKFEQNPPKGWSINNKLCTTLLQRFLMGDSD